MINLESSNYKFNKKCCYWQVYNAKKYLK